MLWCANNTGDYSAAFYTQLLRGFTDGAQAGDPAVKRLPCALQVNTHEPASTYSYTPAVVCDFAAKRCSYLPNTGHFGSRQYGQRLQTCMCSVQPRGSYISVKTAGAGMVLVAGCRRTTPWLRIPTPGTTSARASPRTSRPRLMPSTCTPTHTTTTLRGRGWACTQSTPAAA